MADLASNNVSTELRPGVWQFKFTSAREFLQALHPLSGFWQPADHWIFRGHADQKWPLLPAAHRADPWKPFTSTGTNCFDPAIANDMTRVRREIQLIREFFSATDESGLTVPDFARITELLGPPSWKSVEQQKTSRWPPAELVALLALAQHYGLPTRLLDWSRLGRVAAYFAALPPKQDADDLAVWALQISALPELRFVGDQAQWHFATAPRSSNPNLHAQSGVFTFCHWFDRDALLPLDELASAGLTNFMSATKQPPPAPCVMKEFVLPRAAAKDLMRLLHLDGVSALTMFPGFAGAAKHVQERLWCGLVQPPLPAD